MLKMCALILFLLLAVGGINISGAAALNKDNKLFADEGSKIEMVEESRTEKGELETLKS